MKIISLIAIPALLTLMTIRAAAHAFLEQSEPRVGSTVAVAPMQVKIWFTERLSHDGSKIEVFDAKETEVDKKDSMINADNPLLMTVSLAKLPPGHYHVRWNAIAIDTHHTHGTFSFDVKP